jgi:hypothetical protein
MSSVTTILDDMIKPRRKFDVSCRKDIDAFKFYLEHNGWGDGGCPFYAEDGWVSIPDMIKDKIVRRHLKIA